MPFEGFHEEPQKDEFAGMDAAALRKNIEFQQNRINVRLIDPDEVAEIEALIERMHARISELES
jgi:hypothetical protein